MESLAGSCSDGRPSPPLKSTPPVATSFSDDSAMDAYRSSLSGTMSAPSTGSRGEGSLMSSQEGFHAKTFPPLEKDPASPESVQDFGRRWHESSARYDRASSSWKTHQCLFDEVLPWSSVTLPRWGMMLDGVCWEPTTLALRTSASGSGCWPTPTARDWKDGSAKSCQNVPENCLLGRVVHGGHPTQRTWPGPTASTGGAEPDGKTGRKLVTEVKNWTTPTSSDTGHRKTKYAQGVTPTSMQAGGALNPDWVEWLMGWPMTWTSLEPMAKERWIEWQVKHGQACSAEGGADLRGRQVRPMPGDQETATAPQGREPGEQRSGEHRDLVPAVPQGGAHGQRHLGQGPEIAGQDVPSVHGDVQAAQGDDSVLRQEGLHLGTWPACGWQEMVPRVATGVEHRVNRLRAIGNGQVPLVAATAWTILGGPR